MMPREVWRPHDGKWWWVQMNRGEAAALAGTLQRMPSGNVYDNFPCIRVGDFVLPSSMDLRAPSVIAVFAPCAHGHPHLVTILA